MQLDIERRLAIAELLEKPDPPDLRYRGNRLRLEGKPERFELVPMLASAFVQAKLLALYERRAEGNPEPVPAVMVVRSPLRKPIPFAA